MGVFIRANNDKKNIILAWCSAKISYKEQTDKKP